MQKKLKKEAICPVDYAFRRIGGKYKGQILWYIHSREGVLRYGELKKMIDDVSPKMLTQALRELEGDSLIKRKIYQEVPPKVEYSLTATGLELIPFIEHLHQWGNNQIAKTKT